jgi:hypothetical protein
MLKTIMEVHSSGEDYLTADNGEETENESWPINPNLVPVDLTLATRRILKMRNILNIASAAEEKEHAKFNAAFSATETASDWLDETRQTVKTQVEIWYNYIYTTGTPVIVVGLKSKEGAKINGKIGTITTDLDPKSDRFGVTIDADQKERAVKPTNFVPSFGLPAMLLHDENSTMPTMELQDKFVNFSSGSSLDDINLLLKFVAFHIYVVMECTSTDKEGHPQFVDYIVEFFQSIDDTVNPLSWMNSDEKALVIELVIENRVKACNLEHPPGNMGINDAHPLVRMTARCEWHEWKLMQDILPADDKTLCRHAESSSSSASWLLAQQT